MFLFQQMSLKLSFGYISELCVHLDQSGNKAWPIKTIKFKSTSEPAMGRRTIPSSGLDTN